MIWNFSKKLEQWFKFKTKACFAGSKLMDKNDILIHSNASIIGVA